MVMSDKSIEFGALKIFATVSSSETLTQAAERLGITQSAVSQAIKQLETLTNSELVERRSRPIRLTASGRLLNSYAEKILDQTHRMMIDVQMASSYKHYQLKIGMIDSVADIAALPLLERMRPEVPRLMFKTGIVSSLASELVERRLDMLVSSERMESNPDLVSHPVLRDPFLMVVPESCCKRGAVDLQAVASAIPFIRYNRELKIGGNIDLVLRRLGLDVDARYSLDSTQTMLRLVRAGHGWAIVTALGAMRYPRLLKGVKVMPLAKGANARYISVVSRKDEFDALAEKISGHCREVYEWKLAQELFELVPWLKEQAYSITKMPMI